MVYQTSDYTDSLLQTKLTANQLAVLRTDTIYGLVARADSRSAVEKIFQLKQRDNDKPLIVLVASLQDIPGLTPQARRMYHQYSQARPTSMIVPATSQPTWLTRGLGSVAYRQPAAGPLRELINQVGPLVAPSANPQGLPPARTLAEAIDYFGEAVAVYVDGGTVPKNVSPSKLIRLDGDTVTVIRA